MLSSHPPRRPRFVGGLAALACGVLALSACSAPSEPASAPAAPEPAETASPVPEDPSVLPTEEETGQAEEIVAAMSDSELAGSVIMGDGGGTTPEAAAALVRDKNLAGIIVMGYNLPEDPTTEQVTAYTGAIKEAAGDRGWTPVIGVDQEGGPVARLGTAAYSMPPMMAHGAADDAALTEAAITSQADQLRELGFTLDFAPDADVTIGEDDPTINVRAASDEPERAARAVEAAVEGFSAAGLGSNVKHFPGHGSITVDTHERIGVLEKDREELEESDLVPMKAGVEAGAPVAMVGHMALEEEPDVPASLNPDTYDFLRESLGFDGVVTTDALNMGAVDADGNEAVAAVKAGADLALLPTDAIASQEAMLSALQSGEVPRERMEEASTRVVAMQLASARATGEAAPELVDSSRQDLADAALTVVKGECRVEPADSISIVAGTSERRARMEQAAEDAGLTVGEGGTTVALVGEGESPAADVVVGAAGPWALGEANAETTLATYASTPEAFRSVAEYLAGDLEAAGTLPVEVDGAEPPNCG